MKIVAKIFPVFYFRSYVFRDVIFSAEDSIGQLGIVQWMLLVNILWFNCLVRVDIFHLIIFGFFKSHLRHLVYNRGADESGKE